jgi:hypothetical protein
MWRVARGSWRKELKERGGRGDGRWRRRRRWRVARGERTKPGSEVEGVFKVVEPLDAIGKGI